MGAVCSDEEWLWCSCVLGNLETYSVHQNWKRHTRLDKLPWCLRQRTDLNHFRTKNSCQHRPGVSSVWKVEVALWLHGLYRPWNSPGQNTGVGGCSFLQGIFPTQGLNPALTLQADSLPSEPPGKPENTGVGSLDPFSRRSSWPSNQTGVSCITGEFFTSWAPRKAVWGK